MVTPRIPGLRLDPAIVASSADGCVHLLIRGDIRHADDLDALTVSHDGSICNRLVFGRSAAADRAFAMVVSRTARALAATATFDIAIATHSGAVVRESVTVAVGQDGARVTATYADHAAICAAAAPPASPPLLVQVEVARLEAGRLILRGWLAAAQPVVVVQAFLGDTHAGSAKLGQCRDEVRAAFPDHAVHAQFLASLPAAAPPSANPTVRVQAILADGDSQEAEVPLRIASTRPEPSAAVPEDARATADIRLNCDTATLSEDGIVALKGWCVAAAGLRRVRVTLDGATLGEAECGGARLDVAAVHPELPDAASSGFTFLARLDGAPPPGARLTLIAEDALDRATALEMPLTRVAAAPAAARFLKINLDGPAIDQGVATSPITGHLTIEGWALADSPIASVEILLDDERLGEAYYGLARPDVAQAFPEHDNALRSGFTFHCPPRALRNGAHEVALVFHIAGGHAHTERFRMVVQKSGDADEGGTIRARMTLAERRHRARVRAALGPDPAFVVHVRGQDGIATTLASLRTQVLGTWQARDGDTVLATGPAFGLSADPLHIFLNAGDRLGCDALDEYARAALRSGAGMFYADESTVFAPTGERGAFLKPGFSPELLLATNYIGNGFCTRASALGDIDPAAPLYDIALRLAERTEVQHIPALLIERGPAPPPPPWDEGAAVQRAIERRGIPGRVIAGRLPGTWRVQPAAPFPNLVSIIIPTCGAADHIVTCLRTLRERTAHAAIEIVVIDNIPDGRDALRDFVHANADRVVRIDERFNWSRFNNTAVASARGGMLLFLNDDVEITERGWLDAMLELATRPGIGAVGPRLLYPDGRVQHAGMFLSAGIGRHVFRFAPPDDPGYFGLALTQRDVIAVTGACMLVSRANFDALGGFDEAHDVINNDLDFCLRLHEAGLRTVYTPAATLIHHELASRAGRAETFDTSRFAARWAALFASGDPYFHANFERGCDDMRPAEEPVGEIFGGHPLFARDAIHRILAVKVDHIGDFITAIPVLRRLKRGFPAAHLTVLGAPGVRGLAALEPAIDAFIPFQFFHAKSALGRSELDDAALDALGVQLAAEAFDLAIDLRKHPDTRPLLRRSGATVLAGFDYQGQFPWLDVALEWEGDRGLHPKRFHVSDDLAHLVDAVIAAAEEDRDGFDAATLRAAPMPDLPAKAAALFRRPVVCVHAGAGNPLKEWPPAHFAALATRLLIETPVAILFVGGPDEAAGTDAILADIRVRAGAARARRTGSVAGAVALRDLPALFARCAVYVGNDSGPKHMAAATGVPVVGIHSGSVDPLEWAPLGPDAVAIHRAVTCSPCYISDSTRCPRGIACMTGITPDRVFATVTRLLTLREKR